MPWKPGSRAERLALETPFEDVPPHLLLPLWKWMEDAFEDAGLLFYMGIHMRMQLRDPRVGYQALNEAINQVGQLVSNNAALMLDCIEWILELYNRAGSRKSYEAPDNLRAILNVGNSAYEVRPDNAGLQERIAPAVRDQVQSVVSSARGSAGEHLTAAWNAAYGRSKDPVRSYSEAIKAVEAAAAPVASPTNLKATLGTLIRDLRAKPAKWTFAIPTQNDSGIVQIQQLMSLLWEGQTSRHGGNSPTVPETLGSARAAVHIAATLVQFFTGASVTRVQD